MRQVDLQVNPTSETSDAGVAHATFHRHENEDKKDISEMELQDQGLSPLLKKYRCRDFQTRHSGISLLSSLGEDWTMGRLACPHETLP
jgi:hypothetical protein